MQKRIPERFYVCDGSGILFVTIKTIFFIGATSVEDAATFQIRLILH